MIKVTADKMKVWKNVKEDGTYYFTYSIPSKKQDGTYDYMSKRCRFMKNKEPDNTCDIMVNNAMLSFFTLNDKKYDYLMILDYEELGKQESEIGEEVVIDDDDLPF